MLDALNAVDPAVFTPIGAGKYKAAKVAIPSGKHHISADDAFGIAVYGLAPYTAYFYPGGLDVRQINVQ